MKKGCVFWVVAVLAGGACLADEGFEVPITVHEALAIGEADAVLAASIFQYRQFTIAGAKAYLADRGVTVRK